MVALQGDINGADPLTISGHVTIEGTNCSLRSNASVKINGDVDLTAAAIYAAGTFDKDGQGTVSAPIYANSGQIADPFVTTTSLQNALTAAAAIPSSTASISCDKKGCTGPSGCCSYTTSKGATVATINPGSYGGISVSSQATVVMSPGLFSFRGDVSFQGGSSLTASDVTIVTAGSGSFLGNSSGTMSPPTTSTVSNGAIAGVFFASSSTNTTTFGGTSGAQFSGLLYQPHGTIKLAGNASDGSSGCAEVVAYDITITGNTTLSTNCGTFGLPTINSAPTSSRVALVE